jgi:hypothetical protein
VYAFVQQSISRRAALGDPRITDEFAPGLSERQRQRLNAKLPEQIELARIAEQMADRETVTVPASLGRAFREISTRPWFCATRWLTVAADDMVSPADAGPLI